jgi:hypothetical protein
VRVWVWVMGGVQKGERAREYSKVGKGGKGKGKGVNHVMVCDA